MKIFAISNSSHKFKKFHLFPIAQARLKDKCRVKNEVFSLKVVVIKWRVMSAVRSPFDLQCDNCYMKATEILKSGGCGLVGVGGHIRHPPSRTPQNYLDIAQTKEASLYARLPELSILHRV